MGSNEHRGVTIRSDGWQLSFSDGNRRYREMVQFPQTSKGKQQARDYLGLIKSEITLGIFEHKKRFSKSRSKYPSELSDTNIDYELNRWMRLNERVLAKSTRIDYQRRIDKHLIPRFGHLLLGELKRSEIMEWVSTCGLSGSSIGTTLCPLRNIYNEAIADGRTITNPLIGLNLPKRNTREPQPFTDTEIDAILTNLEQTTVKYFYQFALETGLRTGEQIALLWQDIDWENKRFHVNKAKVRNEIKSPKTKAGIRLVDLSPRATDALEALIQDPISDYVFVNPFSQQPWKDDKALRVQFWKPALKRAGINYREPYLCRHTYASKKLAVEKAVPMWLARQMGHSSVNQVFQTYARWISVD